MFKGCIQNKLRSFVRLESIGQIMDGGNHVHDKENKSPSE